MKSIQIPRNDLKPKSTLSVIHTKNGEIIRIESEPTVNKE